MASSSKKTAHKAIGDWYFRPSSDGGRDYGNSNVFATPSDIKTLVREAAQNSLDQNLKGSAVHLRFELVALSKGSKERDHFLRALNFEELKEHLDAAGQTASRLGRKLKAGLARMDDQKVTYVMLIEDFRSTGMYGDEWSNVDQDTNPFAALVRNNLDSSKSTNTSGGSYGLGKAPLWRSSDIATVLFSSKLSKQIPSKKKKDQLRFSAKSEATWHEFSKAEHGCAGPGWLGQAGTDGESIWTAPKNLEPLFLDRKHLPKNVSKSEATGTSILIVGFRSSDAEEELDTEQVLKEIRDEAARNFWHAIETDRLVVSTCSRRDSDRKSEEILDVEDTDAKPFVAALRDHRADQISTDPEPGETARTQVALTIPATLSSAEAEGVGRGVPAVDANCHLLVRLAEPEDRGGRYESCVAELRGQGMVVRYWNRGQILVGGRPFHAILLAGQAAGNQVSDHSAEVFLRLAEPPAHDRWEYNEDLRDNYKVGSGASLRALREDVTAELRKLVRADEGGEQQESAALQKHLSLNVSAPTQNKAKIHLKKTHLENGCWVVGGEIKILDKRAPLKVSVALSLKPESGTKQTVKWEQFEIEKVRRGKADLETPGVVAIDKRTSSVTFSGRSEFSPEGLDLKRCLASVSHSEQNLSDDHFREKLN